MAAPSLESGQVVMFQDLKAKKMNGKFAYVVDGELNAKGRVCTSLDGVLKNIRPENLSIVERDVLVGDLIETENGEFGHVNGVNSSTGEWLISTTFQNHTLTDNVTKVLDRSETFAEGDTICLDRLSKASLNGKDGKVVGFQPNKKRYCVLVDAKVLSIKPENINLVSKNWNEPYELQNVQELKSLISNLHVCFIQFWSPTCGPCLQLKPWVKELNNTKYPQLPVIFVNVGEMKFSHFFQELQFNAIPYITSYVDGRRIAEKDIRGADFNGVQHLMKFLTQQ